MKKFFKFAFSPLIIVMLVLSLIISLGGIAINIYNLIVSTTASQKFQYYCLLGLCLLLFVFILFVIIRSGYKINKNKLSLCFGFIKTYFPLEDALNLTFFEDKNMLILFFKEEEYTRIVIKKDKIPLFCQVLREENKKVTYFEKTLTTDND